MGVFRDRKYEVVTRIGTAKARGWNYCYRVYKYCGLGAEQHQMFWGSQLFKILLLLKYVGFFLLMHILVVFVALFFNIHA